MTEQKKLFKQTDEVDYDVEGRTLSIDYFCILI